MSSTNGPSSMVPRREDLETRVANRRRELILEIVDHKKNSCRYGAAAEVDKLKARLAELTHIVQGPFGWEHVAPKVRGQLEAWIAK